MIKLNKLAKVCLQTALRRGKITKNSSPRVIIMHISGEWRELYDATKFRSEHLPQYSEQEEEAADIIISTMTYLQRIGCSDIEQLIRDKIEFNNRRD